MNLKVDEPSNFKIQGEEQTRYYIDKIRKNAKRL